MRPTDAASTGTAAAAPLALEARAPSEIPTGSEESPGIAPVAAREEATGTGNHPVTAERPPLTAKVRWQFKAGSDGSGFLGPQPNEWLTDVSLDNPSDQTWTVWPEMVFSEVAGAEAIAGGIVLKDRLKNRRACFSAPFDEPEASAGSVDFGQAPDDTSGKAFRVVIFRGGGRMTVSAMQCDAHWKVNGAEQSWQATPLKKAATLACSWRSVNASTFKPDIKKTPAYQLVHLGPIVYDPADPRGVAYVLVARSARTPELKGTVPAEDVRLLPLTAELLRPEIDDATKPVAWRTQFVLWLWDQPRPVEAADALLVKVFEDVANSSVRMRVAAGYSLLERNHAAALPRLLAFASNKDADPTLRKGIIGGLPQLKEKGFERLSGIVKDKGETKEIREAALVTLADSGGKGWKVIEQMKRDPQVGERAGVLLNNREQAKP